MKRTFQCPKCKYEVEAIATQVAHRCPANKSQLTEFCEVPAN
jgi:predicted Zn-ribbon and HTH transcriptional regulator